MSDKYFFNKFSNAFTDMLDQIQNENYPAEIDKDTNKVVSEKWSFKDFLNFFVAIYFKYIKLLKNIEDSYDQTIHPQLRTYIKRFLENILCRIVQVKKEIIFYSCPIINIEIPNKTGVPGTPYVFLDDYLMDMKLEPRDLNLIIPRYFREDDSIRTKERMKIVDMRLTQKHGNSLPEQDIYPNRFYNIDIKFDEAIKILQKVEMARQGIHRVEKLDNKKDHDVAGELIAREESKRLVLENLMSHFKLKKNKYDDMELVKMIPKENLNLDNKDDPIKFSEDTRNERKRIQNDNAELYKIQKEEMKSKFHKIEEDDIKEDMKNQRRDWISEQIQLNDPKTEGPPYDIRKFYDRNDKEHKEDLDENQLKAKENIAKEKLKGKQDEKKKKDAGQEMKCKSCYYFISI